MRFDLVDLRLFLHVVEAGSITGGAERAHLTLQSASERIRGMEQELGVPLLRRTKLGTRLTEAGRSLEHHARVVLAQVEHMRGDLRQYGDGLRGHIRLLCNTSALSEHLPSVMAEYLAAHPKISINVEERLSHEIAHAIRARTADIGILANSINLEGLEWVPFREDRLVLVVPPGDPLAEREAVPFAEVVDSPFIGLVDGSALQEHIAEQARKLGKRISYRVQLRSFEAVCRMIESGIGIGIVPRNAALRLVDGFDIRVVDLSDSWALRGLVICTRDVAALPGFVRDFIAHLSGHAPSQA
ncbi:Hydrogen peroxide-inducible genes activator [plant metagenome]